MITVERLWKNEVSKFDSPNWRKEEWLIHSALVPIQQLSAAAAEIKSPHDLSFEFGWNFQDEFTFGDCAQHGEITFYPLTLLRKHPISHELEIELSRKFMIYHALQKKTQSQYFHPIDNLLVVETNIESHSIYEPTRNVAIHRDYLRDFLAALKMGLLISVVADRFANAPTRESLEIAEIEEEQLDELSWLSADIHVPELTKYGCFRGRSILRRNFLIAPYDRPRYERSPWHFFGEQTLKEGQSPIFIINGDGKKQALPKNTFLPNYLENGIGKFGYLYFRPEVLHKYLQTPGYSVSFHMRHWGVASLPGGRNTIDVGINSQGLINAFAPDIADLILAEQAYWASFSSLPSGEICYEMFQTRMQQDLPDSPGVTELIRNARFHVEAVFRNQFSVELFNDIEPGKRELCRLSVGPLSNEFSEVVELAKILYGWTIESIKIDNLRTAIVEPVDRKLRQLKLLERILTAKRLDESHARAMTAPLVGLNELRIASAHIGSLKLEPSFQLMGAIKIPATPREGWDLCVNSVVASLNSIALALEE